MRTWLFLPIAVAQAACPATQPGPAPEASAASSVPPAPNIGNPSPVRDPEPAFERFAMPGVQGVIVGESRAPAFYHAIRGQSSTGYWTPEKSDVIALESRLMSFLRGAAPPRSRLGQDLHGYRRQYLGIMREGRQTVFASFFCESHRTDWTRKPIVVDDGGDCYFTLEYDPRTRRFSHLEVNGGA